MEINTILTTSDNIICKQQNSFAVKFLFFKNSFGAILDVSAFEFYMSIRQLGASTNAYNFSLADKLSVYQNELRLNIDATVFSKPGTFIYEIREVWPDDFNSITIVQGQFIINPSITPLPSLASSGTIPVIKTVNVIQPIYPTTTPIVNSYPLSYPYSY